MSDLEREKFEALLARFAVMMRELSGGRYESFYTHIILPQLLRYQEGLARSESAPASTRESLEAEWMAQEEYLDWSNFLLHKLTGEPGESAHATPISHDVLAGAAVAGRHEKAATADPGQRSTVGPEDIQGEAGSPAPAPTEEK